MASRLTSSHLVGRASELAELEAALREAASQQPVLVLLGGDSGVGKTRLVSELQARAAPGSVLMLRGQAIEYGEGELPYAPLLSAFRPLVRESHPVFRELSAESCGALAMLLPGLGSGHEPPRSDEPSAQLRLFEALLELLDLLSQASPVCLILEDIHWADRSTRTFLAFLAGSVRRERVVLLLTYRTDELHRRHALRPLLAELDRLDRARRIHLDPLDEHELAEVLQDILGAPPEERLVERIYARSEGNPLYTEELLAAGLDGRGAAPPSLRDAFMLRLERLSPEAQRVARVIAVGVGLDEPTIEEVTGIESERVQSALRDAVAEHVLVPCDHERLCFRHALLREAVYDDLLPGERGELHRSIARVLEELGPGSEDGDAQIAAAIAGHYAAAGDQPAALRAAVQAALAANAVHAYGDAAEQAERALELWSRVSDAEALVPLTRLELVEFAAVSHELGGDRSRAEMLLRSALEQLDPDSDPGRYSALLARLARVQWTLNRGMDALRTAQRALALLPDDGDDRDRLSLLSWLARTQVLRGRFRSALTDGEQALQMAMAAGDRRSEGELLNTLGMARVCMGQVEEGLSHLRRAIEIAHEDGDVDHLATAYSNLSDMLSQAGRTPEALDTALEGLDSNPSRATRSGDWLSLTVVQRAFEAGDFALAKAKLGPMPGRLVGLVLILRHLEEAEVALGVGDDEAALRCLNAVEPLVERASEPQWIGLLGVLQAESRRRAGELLAARAAIQHALDRIEVCTDDLVWIARVSAVGVRVEADIAQRARDLRERAQEKDALARARIHSQRLRAAAQEAGPVERAWRATGLAELGRARGRSDPQLWRKAAAEWEAIARPYEAAWARWRAAEALAERGERHQAAELAGQASDSARRMGSPWLAGELERLAERARLELADGSARQTPPSSDGNGDDPFGLTARERQVLVLITQGATNKQIGAALYMAEKTASVHVSRILGKLGVRSRTQAAAVAHRMHLDR